MIQYSVIIVTYNSAEFIEKCIKSIELENHTDVELILLDNSSTDSTVQIIEEKFSSIRLVKNKHNVGFAAAVNQAVVQSKSDYLLILNPDTILETKFINKLHKFIEEKPDLSIIGFVLIGVNGEHQPTCWKTPSLKTLFFEMFLPYKLSLKLVTEKYNSLSEVDSVSGACMLVKRNVFEKLSGFDERFFMYLEDLDFCLRARKEGYKVFTNPEIKAVHHIAKSSWQDMQSFFFNLYTSKIYFFRKHYRRTYSFLAYILIISGLKLRVVAYFTAGVFLFNKHLLRLSKYHIFVAKKIIQSLIN